MPPLDQQRERIQDDLRGLIAGDVRCDDIFRQLYSSDASIYEIRPLGVVRPRNKADVAACVQYAAEKSIPIHARGAGSGMAGESLGPGLVMDFSRYMRRVVYIDDDSARLQPGVTRERLNRMLQGRGRIWGPNAGNRTATTMGGLVSVDGAGRRWLKHGSARDHVRGLEIVTAAGDVINIGREPLPSASVGDSSPKQVLLRRLADVLRRNAKTIEKHSLNLGPDRAGYHVAEAMGADFLDPTQLIVGSEGTLGLITEMHVSTQIEPSHFGMAILMFDSLDKAARSVPRVLPYKPSVCDLVDRRHLSLARETDPRLESLLPRETEAVLLVEFDGEEPQSVRDRVSRLVDEVWHQRHLAFGARQSLDRTQFEQFLSVARKIRPSLCRMQGAQRPIPIMEDVAVAPEKLGDFLVAAQNVLKRHEVSSSLYCHAGQGQLHIHPFLDLTDSGGVDKMRRLVHDFYNEVFRFGGTISAEHATGLSRTAFLRDQYGPLYNVFREVKQVFDPQNVFNPGKVIDGEPDAMTRNLRESLQIPRDAVEEKPTGPEETELRDVLELQLNWDPAQIETVARRCNGCGDCRSRSSDVRMCPIFRIMPAEEASPRAKANLIHGVLTGQLDLSCLTSEEFIEVANLCVHCHMCPSECPAGVDIPRLMAEGKGAYVAANGLHLSDRVMSRLDLLSAVASRVSPLANWAIGNPRMRWLMEKTLGIAQGRKLPRTSSRSFLRRATRRRLHKMTRQTGSKVALFVDTYANYHDPQLATAAVRVLKHNGVATYVPHRQKQAGMAAIACGDLDRARRLARRNVAVFADAVRQGYHIVTTEPAVAVCLTREYPNLLDDDDVRLVAENCSDLGDYLWQMHTLGKLQLDFKPLNYTFGYHMPCRLKALQVGSPGESLLRLIPGLNVQRWEEGCSGMAGTFGLKRENYRASLRAGRSLINRLRASDAALGTTECSTCKMQMEQGTTKPTVHPILLLALAYDLMPSVLTRLTTPGQDLLVT